MSTAKYYIGLMSGTSLDGVNALCAQIKDNQITQIATHYQPFEITLRTALTELIATQQTSLFNLGALDQQLALCYSESAHQLLKKAALTAPEITAIGCHGQTIFHHPKPPYRFTMQIGDPNVLAAKTGIPVVYDFRRMDMALGGQGAPLAPIFHRAVFAKPHIKRAIINIGGIANVSLLQGTHLVAGFDTGPGNALLDAWINKHQGHAYDKDGNWAHHGTINTSLLERLLQDPYFQQVPPKSTGKEYFHLPWLSAYLPAHCPAVDIQATLTELTALSICKSWALLDFLPDEIYLCGGGAFNHTLRNRIELLSGLPTHTTAALGIEPDWVEAGLIAWLTAQNIQNHPIDFKAATGNPTPCIPGGLVKV